MSFRRNTSGASLIEILVALAILSVGIYGVAEMLTASRHSANLADQKIRAAGLARLKFAELSAAPAGALRDAAASGRPTGLNAVSLTGETRNVFAQDENYTWRAIVNTDAASPGQMAVTVEVARAGEPDNPVLARMRGSIFTPAAGGGS